MIHAEVQLLDANVQAQISHILELELKYLQNELKTIITAILLLASTVFMGYIMGEPPFEDRPWRENSTPLWPNDPICFEHCPHGWRDLDTFDQVMMVGFTSITIVLSMMTLCSAMFLNLWGANQALRVKTIAELTKAVDAIRRERILTMRFFFFTVINHQMTAIWMIKLYWHIYAFYTGSFVLCLGYFALYFMYHRTRSLFDRAPPIFSELSKWDASEQDGSASWNDIASSRQSSFASTSSRDSRGMSFNHDRYDSSQLRQQQHLLEQQQQPVAGRARGMPSFGLGRYRRREF